MNTPHHIRAAEILEESADAAWRGWSLDDEWIGSRSSKLLMEEKRALAAKLRASSLLEWNYIVPSDRSTLPDDEIRVWVAADDEIYEAYHEADYWVWNETERQIEGVYAWAHIPEPPPRRS